MKTNFSTGLIVAFSKGLINFAFNGLTGNYEKKAEVIINDILRDDYNTGHQFVCMFSNYIFYDLKNKRNLYLTFQTMNPSSKDTK